MVSGSGGSGSIPVSFKVVRRLMGKIMASKPAYNHLFLVVIDMVKPDIECAVYSLKIFWLLSSRTNLFLN